MISIQTMAATPQMLRDVISRSKAAELPDAEDKLRKAMFMSIDIRYGLVDGRIACMWGLIPPTLLSETAYIWLLTTDIAEEHKFLLIRHSQMYMQEALKSYPCLVGDVILPNEPAIKWLKWLGAEFEKPEGRLLKFSIRRKSGG